MRYPNVTPAVFLSRPNRFVAQVLLEGEVITAMAGAFCRAIQKGGYDPCVYTNKSMAYNTFHLGELADYPLWYAEYQPAPSLYYDFRIWQYSASGTVPGIPTTVDLNICFEPYE